MPQNKEETSSNKTQEDDKINVQAESIEPEDKWLIRDCEIYKDEYSECTSFKGRFHQYFIHGESIDCNQWKKDYDNCCKWEDNKDIKAAQTLIASEKKRRLERLRGHMMNDTWKKRESPPAEWDKPLPEWMSKRDENTYLAQKAKEIRGEVEEETTSFCSIM